MRHQPDGSPLGEGETRGPRFWQTLPGILTGAAAIITAVTGLLLAFGQLGVKGDASDGKTVQEQSLATSLPSEGARPITADAIAGAWSGEASQRPGGPFEVRLQIQEGCVLDERCGPISVSNGPCVGDLYFHSVSSGRYEFSVNNFSPPSTKCSPGAGEYLTPRDDGRVLYTTSYDKSIRGILHKRS